MTLGDVIYCRDGNVFLIAEAPDGEWVLINLDSYQLVYPEVIDMYASAYHKGIVAVEKLR